MKTLPFELKLRNSKIPSLKSKTREEKKQKDIKRTHI